MIYEGNEKFIFISYAHKDADKVIPIVEAMMDSGYRVWYDSGIEAGTEWPEYIESHLMNSEVVVVFMTPSTIESRNCRNEINFALELKKEVLVVYLEETTLLKGMRLQLNSTQSLFRNHHASYDTFIRELLNARILEECNKDGKAHRSPIPAQEATTPKSEPQRTATNISNINSIGTNDENDSWPRGTYSQTINRDQFSVVFFHINLVKPIGLKGTVPFNKKIYNSANNLIFEDSEPIATEPNYDKFSMGWILKGSDGSYIPSGEYRFVCSINNSTEFEYTFYITSNGGEKSSITKSITPTRSKKKIVWGSIFGSIGLIYIVNHINEVIQGAAEFDVSVLFAALIMIGIGAALLFFGLQKKVRK